MNQPQVINDKHTYQVGFEGLRPVPTPQQEIFCQRMAAGWSRQDAWLDAWPGSKYQAPNACRLLKQPVIVARMNSIRSDLAALMRWDRMKSVEALAKVVELNEGSPAIVGAVRELNEMMGFNQPVRLEVGAPGAFDVAVRIVDHARVTDGASA